MTDTLQVLRTLDKADRMPPESVFALLTKGRTDASGAIMPGCGLTLSQAAILTGFVFSQKESRINRRIDTMTQLDAHVIDDTGLTAWDKLLDWYDPLPEPKNIAWILDDLADAVDAVATKDSLLTSPAK